MRKYGWPLVLFVGIPFAAILGQTAATYFYDVSTSGNGDSFDLSLWMLGGASLTSVVLLGTLYFWVRNSEQALLRLVWSYALTVAGISALLYFGALLAGYEYSLWPLRYPRELFLLELLYALPLLWFSRQASRASLSHAFFLVFIIGGLSLPDLPESLPFYLEWLWGRVGDILAVWLLVNFDLRGTLFRRAAAVAVVALAGMEVLPLLWLPAFFPVDSAIALSIFPLQLALIYLVRVRRPPVEAGLVSDVQTTSEGDEH